MGGVCKPCTVKRLNFILVSAHFDANVICFRNISRVPKSEGERSLVPFEYAIGYNSAAKYYQLSVSSIVLDKDVRSA